MRFIITPDALDALRAMLDERARHPLLEATPPSERRRAIFLEAFNRGSKLIKLADEGEKLTTEREKLAAKIDELNRQAAAL